MPWCHRVRVEVSLSQTLVGGEWLTTRPGHFTHGHNPISILYETGWALGPVWTGAENFDRRDSNPEASSLLPVALFWVKYLIYVPPTYKLWRPQKSSPKSKFLFYFWCLYFSFPVTHKQYNNIHCYSFQLLINFRQTIFQDSQQNK
jgi:hypothetical protein